MLPTQVQDFMRVLISKTRHLKNAFTLKESDFYLRIWYQINEYIKDVFIWEDLQGWNNV